METELIESGRLELYVYGLLSEEENLEIARIAEKNSEVREEILSIERAIIDLSASFSPYLSAEAFARIRERLMLGESKVVTMTPRRSNWAAYTGWAAALLLLLGTAYFYKEMDERNQRVATIEQEKTTLQESVVNLEIRNKQGESLIGILRDKDNVIVPLAGQAAAPEAFAKVYWNKQTQSVYIDAAGLPNPPEGKVYQVWALKLNPLTPVSIGLLENFTADNQKIFPVTSTAEADAFGITLEPAGGSAGPTMEQLYTLGKV